MRLDAAMHKRGLTQSRSQAENLIKLGNVRVNGDIADKPARSVQPNDDITIVGDRYVSRAALKLHSVADKFRVSLNDAVVLDVGSSTGGFTDYALQHGARKVFAVDVGSDQLHPSLRIDERVVLHEKTDIRDYTQTESVDIVLADVSFISGKLILPTLRNLSSNHTKILYMCKPQFEAGKQHINKGVIKNSKMRRLILQDFEQWLEQNGFVVLDKADSKIAGNKGNVERFYKLKIATP